MFSKAVVRLLECFESAKMIRQCVREIPGGEIDAKVEAIPPGEGVGHVEAPRGETFHYVRSDGSNRPVRHKIRAPSYVNIPTFKASCIGLQIPDVAITLASVDPCYSCTERMGVVLDAATRKPLYDFAELVRLSQLKTRADAEGLVGLMGPILQIVEDPLVCPIVIPLLAGAIAYLAVALVASVCKVLALVATVSVALPRASCSCGSRERRRSAGCGRRCPGVCN